MSYAYNASAKGGLADFLAKLSVKACWPAYTTLT